MKYRLTGETFSLRGKTLRRIQRPGGETGGFIESEANLSQDGAAWVHDGGYAYDNARVVEDAQVYGEIHENAAIRGSASLHGEAFGCAVISDRAKVYGKAGGNAAILGEMIVEEDQAVV